MGFVSPASSMSPASVSVPEVVGRTSTGSDGLSKNRRGWACPRCEMKWFLMFYKSFTLI